MTCFRGEAPCDTVTAMKCSILIVLLIAKGAPAEQAQHDTAAALQANVRGSKAMDQNNLTVALREFDLAIAHDPELAIAWVNRGWARFLSRDDSQLDAAEQDERKGLQLAKEPNIRGAAAYNLGRILERKRDLAEAAAQFRESLRVRPGNKTVIAALLRVENLARFAPLAGVDVRRRDTEVWLAGPVDFSPQSGGPTYRGAVVVRHPPKSEDSSTYEYTVVVLDAQQKLIGKASLRPTEIQTDIEHGKADAAISTLPLGNQSVLKVDKRVTKADNGTGNWPDGHYDYMSLFTVENGALTELLTRPLRVEYSTAGEGHIDAYKIEMSVKDGRLVFLESEKRNDRKKPAARIITYQLKNGKFYPDGKSLVPAEE